MVEASNEPELTCPFCDRKVSVPGHIVKGPWITQCPSLGTIVTPGKGY